MFLLPWQETIRRQEGIDGQRLADVRQRTSLG